jgi:hypothetical protein
MPLLKPPAPEVTKRKYYVRIDEPVAQQMEKYAQFLGSKTVDYVIAEALDFVFKKDTQFHAWLAEHPGSPPTKPGKANASKPNGSTIAAQKAPETAATARPTI